MEMIFCPNCGRRSGFKRALGFGTVFMVVLTFGLWLLVIPFYPARCMNCGMSRGSAFFENLIANPRRAITISSVAAGLVLVLFAWAWFSRPAADNNHPAEIIKGPDYDEARSTSTARGQVAGDTVDGPITIDASSLLSQYEFNEDAAETRYKDKNVNVTGVLTGVFTPSSAVIMKLGEKGR